MGYEEKSIREVITEIDAGKYYLPALQRKFVWDEDRITMLFDSILRGYPISTFLFWFLQGKKANEYVFYKVLDKYDERKPFNIRKDGLFTQEEIIGVLDGQQRLSSIYIGLQGKYITKTKYKRHTSADAWPERQLYINLLNTPFELDTSGTYNKVVIKEDENFEFRFLKSSKTVSKITGTGLERHVECWLRVGELIGWDADTSANDIFSSLLSKETDADVQSELKTQQAFVIKTLEDLRDKFIKDKIINYFKTSKEDLEAILNIFVRVNSGAVALSKSDLLFSTIIATWQDGREEIESLQKKLNEKGDGFSFGNEFLMRSLLVLSDLPVLFKVNSFKSENVKTIQVNWADIKKALLATVDILAEAGLSSWLIPSQNAVIPIAYYIYKGGVVNKESKIGLIKYLKHAFLKNVFGAQGDGVLVAIRKALTLKDSASGKITLSSVSFSFAAFCNNLKLSGDKSLVITEDDMEEFLETKKSTYSFLLLSMIYPDFKYGQVKLHQDHIHPHSGFKDQVLEDWGLDAEKKQEWWSKRDMLPNLQLLKASENQSKSDRPFKEWLKAEYDMQADGEKAFLERNYIGKDAPLDLKHFEDFFETRKENLKEALKKVLQMKSSAPVQP